MPIRYWDYWSDSTNSTATTTTGSYYSNWTHTSGTSATTCMTNAYIPLYAPPPVTQHYVITGYDDWSDHARAVLTRLINDETNTGFKVKMWMRGEVQITAPSIMVRDLDWFLLRLRQVATSADYQKIADHVAAVRAELASGTLTEGGDVEQAPGDSLSGPTAESRDAQ